MTTTDSLLGFRDIFYDVVSHLAADLEVFDASCYNHESSDSKYVRRTLARLATVHSAISRPALTALWSRLWDDRPLRHLLWVVGIARKTSSYNQWRLPPLEVRIRPAFWPKSSWERFQEYASFVHEIVLDPFIGTVDILLQSKKWQDDFWCRLPVSSVVGNTLILPNLRAASLLTSCSFVHRPYNTGMFCLLNPSIRELNIVLYHTVSSEENKARTAIHDCLSVFRSLEVLSVEISFPLPFLGSLAQFYPRLHHLRLCTDCPVDSYQLILLTTFRHLEYLSIDLSPNMELDVPVAFPRLRVLVVHSRELVAIRTLIVHMDPPQLQALSMIESHTFTTKLHREMQAILRPLVVKCPLLTTFEWECKPRNVPRDGAHPRAVDAALGELIGPLLSHRTLRRFSAHFSPATVRYTPADFRQIAEAWPALESFHLRDAGCCGLATDQYADLESLLVFARCCPCLRSLRLPDVECGVYSNFIRTTVAGEGSSGGRAAPHGLRDLRIMRSIGGLEGVDGDAEADRLVKAWRRWVEGVFPFAMVCVPG